MNSVSKNNDSRKKKNGVKPVFLSERNQNHRLSSPFSHWMQGRFPHPLRIESLDPPGRRCETRVCRLALRYFRDRNEGEERRSVTRSWFTRILVRILVRILDMCRLAKVIAVERCAAKDRGFPLSRA